MSRGTLRYPLAHHFAPIFHTVITNTSRRSCAITRTRVMTLIAVAMVTTGHVSMWAILAVGLFNSIMFPTIFALAIEGLGKHTGQGSGILCMAIVGGAILPVLQGVLADSIGIQHAFVLPFLCYAYIAYYGLRGHLVSPREIESAKEMVEA